MKTGYCPLLPSGFVVITLFVFMLGPSKTQGQAVVRWHPVTNSQPTVVFALDPANPTTTNTVSFVAPTDGQVYVNACYASVANGDPAIAVDSTNQTITVSFTAATNFACPQIVAPVSGVEGQFGPLRSGAWVLSILQNSDPFSVVEAPLGLSIQAPISPSTFRFEWPVSGESFALEFNDNLTSGIWQAVTNAPIAVSNGNTLQLHCDAASQFFRLRRLPP